MGHTSWAEPCMGHIWINRGYGILPSSHVESADFRVCNVYGILKVFYCMPKGFCNFVTRFSSTLWYDSSKVYRMYSKPPPKFRSSKQCGPWVPALHIFSALPKLRQPSFLCIYWESCMTTLYLWLLCAQRAACIRSRLAPSLNYTQLTWNLPNQAPRPRTCTAFLWLCICNPVHSSNELG